MKNKYKERKKAITLSLAIGALLVSSLAIGKEKKDDGFSDIRIGNFTYHYSPRYNIPRYDMVSETGLSKDEYYKLRDKIYDEQKGFYFSKQKKGNRIDFKNTPACKPENNPLVEFKNSSGFVCKVPMVYALRFLSRLKADHRIPRTVRLSGVIGNIGESEASICKRLQKKLIDEGCPNIAKGLWSGTTVNLSRSSRYQFPWLTVHSVYDYLKTGKLAHNPILDPKK